MSSEKHHWTMSSELENRHIMPLCFLWEFCPLCEYKAGQSQGRKQGCSKELKHIKAGNTVRTQSSCIPAAGDCIAHVTLCTTLLSSY